MDEDEIKAGAVTYIKGNAKLLIDTFAPPDSCKPVAKPVSVFMAGSPGAGKTEVSKSFMGQFSPRPVRIDADDIRALCPGYEGSNSHLFQDAANKGVNILYDHALDRNLNCILDGTFAYGLAEQNIQRSLKRGRVVEVWFVFQDLESAWEFTKIRELEESRHVSKDVFVRSFFRAKENVASVKTQLKSAIKLNILIKDYKTKSEDVFLNVSVAELDRLTDCGYSLEELSEKLV